MGQQGGQTTTTRVEPDPFAQQSGQNLFNAATGYLNQFGDQQVAGQQPFSQAGQGLLAQGLLGYNPGFQMPEYGPSPTFQTGQQGLQGFSQTYTPLGGGNQAATGSGGGQVTEDQYNEYQSILANEGEDAARAYQMSQTKQSGGGLFGSGSPLSQAQQAAAQAGNYTPQQVAAPQVGAPGQINVQAPGTPGAVSAPTVTPQGVNAPSPINVQAPGAPDAVPTDFSAGQVQAPNAQAPDDVQAQQVRAAQVAAQQVSPGSFLSGPGIGAYQNPHAEQVIDTALSDIDRSRQLANQQGARSAGASTYGGDRNALIEAETNRGFADTAARTAAQLRSQGFSEAAGLYGQDLNRGLQAGLANQQAGLQAGEANQNAGLRASLANQGTGLQAALANQDMAGRFGQFNAANQLQAQMANQGAGLDASRLGLQGALANQSAQQRAGEFGASLGFDAQAQNAANQMQASLANQSTGLQAGLANQGTGLQASLANQQAQQRAGEFGASLGFDAQAQNVANQMQAGQFDASNQLQAGLANQQAGLAGAGLNLDAAGLMGQLGGQQFNQLLSGAGALNQMGLQNQQLAQQYINQPLNNISYLNNMLQGNPFGGQSQYTTQPGGSQGAGIAGGALSGAGTGAYIGSVVPGLGTAVGAGVGGLLGGLGGWLG